MTPFRQIRRRAAATCAALAALWCLSHVAAPAARWQSARQPAFQASSLQAAAGQGLLLGILGGYRSIMADFAWVRAYVFWERQDRAACETHMRLSATLDPANPYFWRQMAHITAFDMPHWEIWRLRHGGTLTLAPAVARQRTHQYARHALKFLAEGAARNPLAQAQFWADAAIIALNRLEDPRQAVEFYRRAAECPNPSWFAPRAYAIILGMKLGEPAAAARWLRAYIQRLQASPGADPHGLRAELEELAQKLEAGPQKRPPTTPSPGPAGT
jgi:hypothetical protein